MRNTNFERYFSFVTYLIIKELPKKYENNENNIKKKIRSRIGDANYRCMLSIYS